MKYSTDGLRIIPKYPNVLDDPKEIVNKFNDYFVNVGPNLANTIKQVDNSSFAKYHKGNYL